MAHLIQLTKLPHLLSRIAEHSSLTPLRRRALSTSPALHTPHYNLTQRQEFNVRTLGGRMFVRKKHKRQPRVTETNLWGKYLLGCPQVKGVVLKVFFMSPSRGNSGNKRMVRAKLSNGICRDVKIPGEGHNLNVHSTILIRRKRIRNLKGVYLEAIRGKYDLNKPKRVSKRALYGIKLPQSLKDQRLNKLKKEWDPSPAYRSFFNKKLWYLSTKPLEDTSFKPQEPRTEVPYLNIPPSPGVSIPGVVEQGPKKRVLLTQPLRDDEPVPEPHFLNEYFRFRSKCAMLTRAGIEATRQRKKMR
eukprot:GHVN01094302.1.p1 GENE.GHVN01094302.1~~GHVN01094302.1.p1  ORF type:complete len:321 (+),score=42.00 GHVN01094302.1:62-964(+)